jgi:hypothetical protein
MAQYIDKDALLAEIDRLDALYHVSKNLSGDLFIQELFCFINTIEVKEADLEKLGGIARHLIAVKEHIEDMRLDKEEWFMLEKIGYPEKFKAQKGE